MGLISFEWNDKKSQANIKKHKVSFEEAQSVFFDSNARMIFDPDHSINEDRYILLGLSSALRILTVVHCVREDAGKIIRIISARKATRNEQKQYKGYLT